MSRAIDRQARGFSLLEAMAALAIAGVIIAGATGAVMNINRLLADTSRKTAAWNEAKRLEEFLIAEAQGAGGGQLRPHTTIFIEDARATALSPGNACRSISGLPSCTDSAQGADRLTIFKQRDDFPACRVTDNTGGGSIVLEVADGPGAGTCCLDDAAGGVNAFEGVQALFVGTNATVSIRLFNRQPGCRINAPPGQGSGLVGTDIVAAGFPGTLVVADVSTFYVDRAAHELVFWRDTDGDNIADANEKTVVHDRVYDLQLAAGYDGRPEDGRLEDSNDGADEFLYNSTLDAAMPSSVIVDQLRMLQIAVVVGTPSQTSGGNSISLLNRPAPIKVPGVYLTATSSKAYMRNLALFTQ